jgi:hypothetical protein
MFVCFVWISEQTAIISLYNSNWLVFVTETEIIKTLVTPTNAQFYYILILSITQLLHVSTLSLSIEKLKQNFIGTAIIVYNKHTHFAMSIAQVLIKNVTYTHTHTHTLLLLTQWRYILFVAMLNSVYASQHLFLLDPIRISSPFGLSSLTTRTNCSRNLNMF